MKWFQEDENIKSYTPPVLKAVLSVLSIVLIVLSFPLMRYISTNNIALSIIIKIASVAIELLSVLRIYISFGEILALAERREKAKKAAMNPKVAAKKGKCASVNSIISLLDSNDIIEFLIVADEKIIELGATSDSKQGSAKFFNKKFYLGDNEDISIEGLREALEKDSKNGKICILEIDGVSPDNYPELQ